MKESIKKYLNLIKRIGYIIIFAFAIDQGYGLHFILITTAIICIIYRKQLWKTMNLMSDIFLMYMKFDKKTKTFIKDINNQQQCKSVYDSQDQKEQSDIVDVRVCKENKEQELTQKDKSEELVQ